MMMERKIFVQWLDKKEPIELNQNVFYFFKNMCRDTRNNLTLKVHTIHLIDWNHYTSDHGPLNEGVLVKQPSSC